MNYQQLLLDENSVDFLKKHRGLIKKNYTPDYNCKQIPLSLDDLIDKKKYQTNPNRLIFTKVGFTHLKLLLSISSPKEIECFFEKISNKKIIDPDIPAHNETINILKQYLLSPNNNGNRPSIKFELESLNCLKKMMSGSIEKNIDSLKKTKEDHLYCMEAIKAMDNRIKDKMKEKFIAENDVIKISEEKGRVESLKKSISNRENKVRFIRKRIDLSENYLIHEHQGKSGNALYHKFHSKMEVSEENKYRYLLDLLKEQKSEVKKNQKELLRFAKRKNEVYKKYNGISDELLQLQQTNKSNIAFKKNLSKEIESLSCRIKNQQSELKSLKKIINYSYRFESTIDKRLHNSKSLMDVHKKFFERYKENKNNNLIFDIEDDAYGSDFSKINSDVKNLCGDLFLIQQENQNTLKQASKLPKNIIRGKKRFEKIKNELSFQVPLSRTIKLRKEIIKNGKFLSRLQLDFNKIEEKFDRTKKEEEAKLLLLKEIGEKYYSFAGKRQVLIELAKEKALSNENLLKDLHMELIGLRVELATNYEILNLSSNHNRAYYKILYNNFKDIEKLCKSILYEIQNNRNSLEKEESTLSFQTKEQEIIQNKYKEFSNNVQGLCLCKEDIEVLVYQNSELEKKLNDLCAIETRKYELKGLTFESSYHVGYFNKGIINRIYNFLSINGREKLEQTNRIISKNKIYGSVTRFFNVESSHLIQTGAVVFLILSCFSYLLIYKSNSLYNNKNGFLASYLSMTNISEKEVFADIKELPDSLDAKKEKKTDLINEDRHKKDLPIVKTNTLHDNSLKIIPFSLIPEAQQTNFTDNDIKKLKIDKIWSNYIGIFDDLRFDKPSNAFRLLELMTNKQVLDLTLMDSIQLLYSVKKILQTEGGPFFDRLFHDFTKLGMKKKEAVLNLTYNYKLIEEINAQNITFIFKGKIKPIKIIENMNMKDFEKIIVPYIITNYNSFAKAKKISIPETINDYASNLAQDIYMSAKKFHVPVTSLLTIAHQESFFINILGDNGESSSPFQIYNPTKLSILVSMKNDGFKVPEQVSNLENHITFATFMAAYHFSNLMKRYAVPIIDPIIHKPSAFILNLGKSTRYYNGGKKYKKNVLQKQKMLEKYLRDTMKVKQIVS